MNQLEIKKVEKCPNWIDYECFIDDVRLSQYLHDNKTVKIPDYIEPFDDLCLAWVKGLDFWGDIRFIWKLMDEEKAVLPLYFCPEDLDFSCITIVVEVEKTEDFVYWNRIGLVQQTDYDFSIEKKMGISDTNSYTDEDWELYGDNIALAEVDSYEWQEWVSDNWDEELFRRRMNYTRPAYNKPQNILWFAAPSWKFERNQYDRTIDEYWINETLENITDYSFADLSAAYCVSFVRTISRNGDERLKEHEKKYDGVLLHIYLSEEIGEPLFELLKSGSYSKYVLIYSKVIEMMWKYGDSEVKNAVEVTLLERLSSDEDVWSRFEKLISEEFRLSIKGQGYSPSV